MKKITFGRLQDNDIIFDDQSVSRHHGWLFIEGSKVYIIDNNSTNGIHVNGKRVKDRVLLANQDKVVIAKKYTLDWQRYTGNNSDATILNGHETSRADSSLLDSIDTPKSNKQPLIDIPSKMEINQNYANVYRNGSNGADWKVPLKRNMGDKIGNAVGSTLGCIISIVIVILFIALLVSLGS